ncbi:glycoside hydrolase family 127 protein, partial [Blautia wexlerae]|nr:glycoside hydrolase family 127 protein [Blautia wexlerae]
VGTNSTAGKDVLVIGYADGAWHYSAAYKIEGGFQANTDYHLKAVLFEDTISIFLDGKLMHQFTDTRFPNGRTGLRSYSQAFDSSAFKVRTVSRQDLIDCGISANTESVAQISEWNCETYDGKTAGRYTFKGTLAPSKEYSNPGNVQAEATVVVREAYIAGDNATAVPFDQVNITDEFWRARQKAFICQVIPNGITNVEKSSGGIPGIRKAGQVNRGELEPAVSQWSGAYYTDSDVHKVVESMAYALQIDPMGDAETIAGQERIKEKLEEWIPVYQAAQEDSGYFDSYFTVTGKEHFWDFSYHELYCMGHFYEAAVAHYRATGDTRLFDMAVKNADYLTTLFGPGLWRAAPGHQEIELALVKLANLCNEIGEKDGVNYKKKADSYVDLCKFFLDMRGDTSNRHGVCSNNGSARIQDHLPVVEQFVARGHCVRAQYMYAGMADYALYEGDGVYDEALQALWNDVANGKQYVTGGVGASASVEGFNSTSFSLPLPGYCETCAQIGNAMWNQRMNLLYGESKYADMVERTLYNSIISCVNFDGDKFFYDNPQSSNGGKTRNSWYGTACCPPNLMRTVVSLGGYMYTQKKDEITLNLYVDSEATLDVGGDAVVLNLDSDMPWEGSSTMTVGVDAPKAFTLRLRVPDWAIYGNSISVNGEAVSAEPNASGYVVINREWSDGDKIAINFPMEADRIYPDERAASLANTVSVRRGPFIYAAEKVDNNFALAAAGLPGESTFTGEWIENLTGKTDKYGLQPMMTLSAKGETLEGEVTWKFIPYYAWCNRGDQGMQVYIKEGSLEETPLEQLATASASYVHSNYYASNLNDGNTGSRWSSYKSGSVDINPWVQYDFTSPVTLSGSEVMWYNDNGGSKPPDGVTFQYWDASANKFVDVARIGAENDTFKPAQFNTYLFEPVVTSRIRMIINNETIKTAPCINEWKLIGSRSSLPINAITTSVTGGAATVNAPAKGTFEDIIQFSVTNIQAGKVIDHISVRAEGSEEDILVIDNDNGYSFGMPEKPVTITVVLRDEVAGPPIRIACVGDSITYGDRISDPSTGSYPAQLQKMLGSGYEVGNFGVNNTTMMIKGSNPYMNKSRYTDSLAFEPDIVVIMLGTNDGRSDNEGKLETNFKASALKLIHSYMNLPSSPKVYIATSSTCYRDPDGQAKVIAERVIPLQKAAAAEAGCP